MKRVIFGFALLMAGLMLPGAAVGGAHDSSFQVSTKLTGFQETPSILSDGTGTFSATVTGTSLTYRLRFSNLSAPVTQSHIHFGQTSVAGGVFVFLCSNLGNGTPGTPTCAENVTITRTVTAADIIGGAAGQGLAAGDFAGVVRVLRSGNAYVNVHSTAHPGGEIRGQLRVDED
jgi:hypothetical protein